MQEHIPHRKPTVKPQRLPSLKTDGNSTASVDASNSLSAQVYLPKMYNVLVSTIRKVGATTWKVDLLVVHHHPVLIRFLSCKKCMRNIGLPYFVPACWPPDWHLCTGAPTVLSPYCAKTKQQTHIPFL